MRFEGIDAAGRTIRHRRAEAAARRALARMQDELLGLISHELRTPLTAIRGSLGLLATGQLGSLDPRGQRMLEVAAESTERLVRLVNDALDLERLESGLVPFAIAEVDAASVAAEAIALLRSPALEAGVVLSATGAPTRVMADADRLRQMLAHLLANAIAHSPKGGAVTVTLAPGPDGMAVVSVHDQGPGLPPDKLEVVFERFRHADASDDAPRHGLGLGLAIGRAIARRHGGRLWAESPPGEGATFLFTVPRAP